MESVSTTASDRRTRDWPGVTARAVGMAVAFVVGVVGVVVESSGPTAAVTPDRPPGVAAAFPTGAGAGEKGILATNAGRPLPPPPSPAPAVATKVSADEIEGWRLFSNAKKVMTCAAWLQHRQTAQGPAGSGTDGAAPYMFSGMDAERECLNQSAADVASAKDELVRAAMLGNLDARYELLNDQLDTLRMGAGPTPEQASQLLGDLRGLALAGNRAAGFLLSDTLANGTLGVRDESLSIAWTMVSMQGGAGFDRALVASYGGYAGASAADQKALLDTARVLYDQCCHMPPLPE